MSPQSTVDPSRPATRAFALVAGLLAVALGGCSATARILGSPPADLPLPAGVEVAFNQRADHHYRSPISGERRRGDDLERLVLDTIERAQSEIVVAVQELSLPRVAEALVTRKRQGVRVRVILENTYSTPFSEQLPAGLSSHQLGRYRQLLALADTDHDGRLSGGERDRGDAVRILQRGGIPLIDDTADGSAGSGLMHHKFMVVDQRWVVTGSANFTPSCIHGDPDDRRTLGNVNHLLRFESRELAALFGGEFSRMWGDGPGGLADSRFGIAKEEGPVQAVMVGPTRVEVLFAPHRRKDPSQGLRLLDQRLALTRRRLDLSLFVFSAQGLADRLAKLRQRGVAIRLLADPGFASRSFSEVLDLLGVSMPDRFCKLEQGNSPWAQPIEGVGTPLLARGDKLHHKFAVVDGRTVITGSFNWSPSAAHGNDETLMIVESPQLAAHFTREQDRMWQGAELGITPRLRRKLERIRQTCGQGTPRALATATQQP
ncbi:phospholipase D-like domain-containing protein [Synechococcus sp. BA-124 BA4]|uniref:phospholipase D-like domain-containing protein n=1 Tax=unclassified Synechococcus TaxID=2626047 RepID=UPI002AD58487|nr:MULTISPECIES: phospholipase D-like domain-containing protein [unclassified Synechococcus]MEA5399174.1 phospholipase D-like domain-containing protein [Synechococcus sp. BA-124 BA4]CAK6701369.1 Cardiolipin synthase B [Synechococcus sp. CBW1107]